MSTEPAIRLGPSAQLAAVLLIASACAGSAIAGFAVAPGGDVALLSDPAHDTAISYAAPPPGPARVAVAEIRDSYEARLARMTADQQRLASELEAARDRRQAALTELSRTEQALRDAAAKLARAGREIDDLRQAGGDGGAQQPGSAQALAAAKAQLAGLQLELAAARSSKQGLTETLDAFAQTMGQVIAERDDAAAKAEKMDETIGALSEAQNRRLDQLEEAARVSLDGIRRIFGHADLEVDRILDETRDDYTGSGGPFEALADDMPAGNADDPTEIRLAALMNDYEELNLMRFAAERLPFGVPVEGARRTSHFGPRLDPMGRGKAMHKGEDFAAPRGTPVHATADGVITFSGRQRGYGNIVIIQHAFGIETRYAHLKRSRVNVGQRVERGDHIADLGSTGRSTGPHLHYEVRIDREAVNPAKFFEAAHDVL